MNAIVKRFLVASFFLLTVSSAVSESPNARIDPSQYHPIITGDEPLPRWSRLPNNEEFPPPPAVDTIGNVYRAGQTWYDLQYVGSGGRMIQYDSTIQFTHVAWTCGFDSGASTLQVKYNCFDASLMHWWHGAFGQQVPPQTVTRSAFVSLGFFYGIPFPALHESNPRATVPTGNVYHDIEAGVGCFISDSPLPLLSENGSTIQTNWPKIAIGRNGAVHLVTTEGGATSVAGMRQWYHRGVYDPLNTTITWGQPQPLPGRTMNVAGEVVASRLSNRAAVAWMRPVDMDRNPPPAEFSPYNNNVVCAISQNGATWDFNNYQFITHWQLPNPALYPDTLAACGDTFRAYNDISLLFDNSDILHAVFTTNLYYALPEPRVYTFGHIWHWRSDAPNTLHLVAEGGNRSVALHGNPSAWNRTVQNGSLSIGQNGNLYCTFTACYDPRDTANTLNDISQQGRPNYDIYVSVSTNGGLRWSAATNVTDTHTPNAVAGQCRSECFPSSNQTTVFQTGLGDCLQVSYLIDFDAGSAVLNEGSWTNNDFNYHRVPVVSIPTTPLIPDTRIDNENRSLTLVHPNGGERLIIGLTDTIVFQQTGWLGSVRAELNQNYPNGSWITLPTTLLGSNRLLWMVDYLPTNSARIRISSSTYPNISDISNNNFAIASPPPITVISPNGGETFLLQDSCFISWTNTSPDTSVEIGINRNYPTGAWETVPCSYITRTARLWIVSGAISNQVRIRVTSLANPIIGDTCNSNFIVTSQPIIRITSPNGGERWSLMNRHVIGWSYAGLASSVRIQFDNNYPSGNWQNIDSMNGNIYSYYWRPTAELSENARIRITSIQYPASGDTSNSNFAFTEHQSITVVYPNGGERLPYGAPVTVQWRYTGEIPGFQIQLRFDQYSIYRLVTTTQMLSDTSCVCIFDGPSSSTASLLVCSSEIPQINDISNSVFSLCNPATLNLITPNGGEQWQRFSTQTVRFTRSMNQGNVSVYLSRMFPSINWVYLGTTTADTFQYYCFASITNEARVKIVLDADTTVSDFSERYFSIVANETNDIENKIPTEFRLTGIFPNPFNATTDVCYDLPQTTPVTIELYDANGRMLRILKQGIVNAGSHRLSWHATDLASGIYFVRVSALHQAFVTKAVLLR